MSNTTTQAKPKKKFRFEITAKQFFLVLAADILYAIALNCFYVNNKIAAGGLAGIATVINSFIPIPIGVAVLAMSIPIVIAAWIVKGGSYTIMAVITTIMYSACVDLLSFLPCVTYDKLVAVVCGGLLYGFAAAITIKARLSSGGTDLLARLLLTRHRSLSLGTMFLFCDGAVVLVSMLVEKNLEIGIYGAIGIVVSSFVGDKLIEGMNRASIYYIIPSGPAQPIADAIMTELERGVTALKGQGMYAKTERQVLMTVVKPAQGYKVKALVKRIDPGAFVFMAHAAEVAGEGFIDVDASASIERKKGKRK